MFCRRIGSDGSRYCTVDFAYETTEQLRSASLLDLGSHPAIVPMRFSHITPNADGLYAERDFMNLLRSSINEFDRILDVYALNEAA